MTPRPAPRPRRAGRRPTPLGVLFAAAGVALALGAALGVTAAAYFLVRGLVAGAPSPLESNEAAGRVLLGLLAATGVVTVAAAAAAFLLGRRLTRPLLGLAEAARRIGAGDLATPVDPAPGAELGRLSQTMEETRSSLLRLTAELRRRESEAQALLDGITEGVFAVDEYRRIQYLNPQAAALLGVDPDEIRGAFCGDVLRPARVGGERPCESRCPIVHARTRGSTRATEVLELSNGNRRTVVITSSGPTAGTQVQIMRDETDVEGARRARDAIVANVSHEFRTPLSAQLASLELLKGKLEGGGHDGGDAGQVGELVTSLGRSTLRLMHLVDNLLESVRVESGETSIRRTPVPLDEVVDEAVESIVPLLRQRDQRVDVAIPHPAPFVEGDAPRLVQVLVNLLANASKFSPEGTRIGIGLEPGESGWVRAWVEDEGPGLPEGAETQIFERFSRAGEPDVAGMGLGLWIVKSIVERHGGRVEARSLPGGGSRFTVHLPALPAHPGPPSGAAPTPSEGRA